ncbi:MAG: heat-inducible transcriptional repressor HrcA [Bacillota bacterium]
MQMDERKKKVLHAIIQDYVTTAEPVGSRTIARKYNLGVSSATIRNEMADLEEMGYIEQPHTSSGRVPSDKGYRYYVDFLMKKPRISGSEEQYIYIQLKENMQHMENLFKKTSEVLSHLTSYLAVAVCPMVSESVVKQIQLLPLDQEKILVVLISDKGIIDSKVVSSTITNDVDTLRAISDILTEKLRGYRLQEINRTVLNEIYFELAGYKRLVKLILEDLEDALNNSKEKRVFIGGTLNILSQPEFKDVERLRNLLVLIDEQSVLCKILQETSSEKGLTISIGGENKYQGIHNCSIINATYKLDGRVLGTVGILGPTRMMYPKASSMVEFITKYLSDLLEEHYK